MNDDIHDHKLRQKLKALDAVFPQQLGSEEALWLHIEARSMERRARSLQWKRVAIAASFFCAVTLAFFLFQSPSAEERIIYTTEKIQTPEQGNDLPEKSDEETAAIVYLKAQCLYEQPICNTEEFTLLKKQLEETEEHIARLNKEMKLFGADPALIRAKVAVENQRTYLLKELIQILHS